MANPKKGASKAAQAQGPQTEFEQRVSADDFRRVVKECLRIKDNAQEYVGQLGNYRRNQVERLGLNNKAFATHLSLRKMEPVKRLDYLRSLIQYTFMDENEDFKQLDMFDDTFVLMERIAKLAEANGSGPAPADASDTLASLRVIN